MREVQTPYRAPNRNAEERFVRSIKEECLDRLIPLGERHLRHALVQFVEHYHRERNHQGLGNELMEVVRSAGPATPFAAANVWVDCAVITIAQRNANTPKTVGPSCLTLRGTGRL